MADTRYTWDKSALRYRGPRGRFVPDAQIRQAVHSFSDAIAGEIREATEKFIAERIRLEDWRNGVEKLILGASVATGAIAVGGRLQSDRETWDRVSDHVRFQLNHFDDLIDEIRSETQAKDGTLTARAAMYAGTATRTFELVRRADLERAGYRQQRRRLSPGAKHCEPCRVHASRGWIDIDDPNPLPQIGDDCECLSSCRCHFEYRLRRTS